MPDLALTSEILARLVAFPTVSRDSNLDLIDWIEDYLAGHGVAAHRVWNEDRTKAALFANVGPATPGGVVLSGHTDVVPVEGQGWTSDPFTLTEREGRLYGRGTCDMKGFIALALASVPEALARGLARPLQLAFSYDEEVGCFGAPPMIDAMVRSLPRAGAVIVGEPSMMKVVTGHKGNAGYQVHLKGHEVHSSLMDRGVNAVMEAARLIGWANDENARARARAVSPLARPFDPPWSTTHCGTIAGGTAANITAGDCRFDIDVRLVPGESFADWSERFRARVAEVEAGMQAVRPETGIHLDPAFDVPPLAPETDGAAEALARRITGDNGRHVVSYATEAGQFQAAGYSTVICGPGDIAQAHQADEFVSLAQLGAGADFVSRVIDTLHA